MNTSREKSANNWNHQFLWFFIVFFKHYSCLFRETWKTQPPPSKNPKLHSQGHKWTQITNAVGHTGPRPKPIILDIYSNKHSSSQKKHCSQFGTHFAVQTRLDKPQQSFQSVSNSKTCHVIFFLLVMAACISMLTSSNPMQWNSDFFTQRLPPVIGANGLKLK